MMKSHIARDIWIWPLVNGWYANLKIVRDAAAAIKSYLPISYERIKAVVKDGWVTLEVVAPEGFLNLTLNVLRLYAWLDFNQIGDALDSL